MHGSLVLSAALALHVVSVPLSTVSPGANCANWRVKRRFTVQSAVRRVEAGRQTCGRGGLSTVRHESDDQAEKGGEQEARRGAVAEQFQLAIPHRAPLVAPSGAHDRRPAPQPAPARPAPVSGCAEPRPAALRRSRRLLRLAPAGQHAESDAAPAAPAVALVGAGAADSVKAIKAIKTT